MSKALVEKLRIHAYRLTKQRVALDNNLGVTVLVAEEEELIEALDEAANLLEETQIQPKVTK